MMQPTISNEDYRRVAAESVKPTVAGVTLQVTHWATVQRAHDGAFVEVTVWVPDKLAAQKGPADARQA